MRHKTWRASLAGSQLDRHLASWLAEPDSLTARCQRACASFRIRLLRDDRGEALADETAGREMCRVREVALECDGVPVIFAHTTLSAERRGRLSRWMDRLGARSLGSLLFAYAGFRRGPIEFRRLDRRHPLYQRAAAVGPVSETLWARRSMHRLGGQQVLVTEVFLPAILALGR